MTYFRLSQPSPLIFHLEFDNEYDLAMHFLRYQEFYESPEFKGQIFSIVDYMDWYAKNESNELTFTYPMDWNGFNVPSRVFDELYENKEVLDWNMYDTFMYGVYKLCKDQHPNFYLIGTLVDDENTMKHEMAHALFNIKTTYKCDMSNQIAYMDEQARSIIREYILNTGYDEEFLNDEMQAYLSTGVPRKLKTILEKDSIDVKTLRKPFMEIYEKYVK